MNAVAEPILQGVTCRNCRKPIRLSRVVIERQSNQNPDLVTKVFAADAEDAIKKVYTFSRRLRTFLMNPRVAKHSY